MNSRLFVPLLFTGAIALACGPRPHPDASLATVATASDATRPEDTAASRIRERARRAKHDGKLVPSLEVTATPEAVRIALAVENAGNKTLEMHFADGQTHDIVVLDSLGREVWRWAEGRMFTQAHRTKPIAGGDTLRVEEEWDATERHGRFTAVAMVRSTNYPLEQRTTFELP